jgi:hypothetical protein
VEAGGYFQETMPRNIFFQQHSFQTIVIDDDAIQIFHAWNKVGANKGNQFPPCVFRTARVCVR